MGREEPLNVAPPKKKKKHQNVKNGRRLGPLRRRDPTSASGRRGEAARFFF